MEVAYIVVAIVLALALLFSGYGKLTRNPGVVKNLESVGVPASWYPFLGATLIAGAVGLAVGIAFRPLGIAAAVGVTLYFLGAVVTHLRRRDFSGVTFPLPFLVLGAAALVLGSLSL